MKRTSMKKLSAVLLLSAVCLAPKSHAQGTLQITFDGPPEQPPASAVTVQAYGESGLSFYSLSEGFTRVGTGLATRPQNGTAYVAAPFGESLAFLLSDGSQFGVVSIDLAEYSTVVPDPVTVHFVGYRHDGSIVTTDFTTDGIIDGTGPLADFQTFFFDTKDWSGLDRVEIPTYGWSLDNLVVSVPEPTSAVLLLAGALLLWRLRHTRI